ncbi:biopolymer transporter ExbD [uncultured Thiodictyon sp.]|uniref:ExbD/TolR family protein n=1 Tax=uncultured Thiodictyon sp. TaxID=1846217 RepID=UPI0025FC8406|nr:biopolymer transporter ExbD [uncultured Thiodictyon sp.]
MNLRPRRAQPSDINLTPLLDVVFLLLIFFMVSTTFKEKDASRLRIQLPQAEGQTAPAQEPEFLRIAIDQAGAFYVDDRAVVDRQTQTLVRAINGALGERKDLPVLIQADAMTPHQAVMTALDAAAQVGLLKISFSASRGSAAPVPAQGGGR